LGLSLALAFVRAHGGDIIADSDGVKGSAFTVALPRKLTRPNLERAGQKLPLMATDRTASVG
jgi:signal transduction histidine kinase